MERVLFMKKSIAIVLSVLLLLSLLFAGCSTEPTNTDPSVQDPSSIPADPYAEIPETPTEEFSLGVHENYVAIRRYLGNSKTVKVPAEIEGKPVTLIGIDSFMSNEVVETIILPDSITEIREKAFMNCQKLTTVQFSNNLVLIENNAFERCSKLTRVELPESIQTVEQYAFSDCASLTEVVINGTDLSVGMAAFSGNPLLKTVALSGVKTIGWAAFQGSSSLESVTIPETVETIESLAFANCDKLANVTFLGNLPDSIGEYTFKSEVIVPTLHYKKGATGLDNPALSHYTLEEYE